MTTEKMCFVSPEDIAALRVQCECGAAGIIPIAKLGNLAPTLQGQCAYCGAPSGLTSGTKALEEVVLFGAMLGKLAANLKGMKIRVSLQIQCPE